MFSLSGDTFDRVKPPRQSPSLSAILGRKVSFCSFTTARTSVTRFRFSFGYQIVMRDFLLVFLSLAVGAEPQDDFSGKYLVTQVNGAGK